jgi:pantothenate kinase
MPWFGVDIGGTLAKLVYFEPNDHQDFTASNTEGNGTRAGAHSSNYA